MMTKRLILFFIAVLLTIGTAILVLSALNLISNTLANIVGIIFTTSGLVIGLIHLFFPPRTNDRRDTQPNPPPRQS